ncbi:VTCN1 inhibitor, partial [Rostratula benghalensis]|nr:VTCN1 inhibitor [Rostratula benghalensis]
GQPDKTCHAFVGETVILPCTTISPGELILSNSILYWQIEHTVLVHFFYKGQDWLDRQEKRYNGRTSLFLDQMKYGNFSLKLSNVQLLDTAEYACIYKQTGDHPNKTQKSKINLIVSGKIIFGSEGGHELHANFVVFNFSGHSQISSRSFADAPFLAMLPLSFHLLVSLGVWHL